MKSLEEIIAINAAADTVQDTLLNRLKKTAKALRVARASLEDVLVNGAQLQQRSNIVHIDLPVIREALQWLEGLGL